MFFVLVPLSLSSNNTLTLLGCVHQESATYNCPWENTGVLKSNPTHFTDWPCDLLIVMANAGFTGNCLLFSGIAMSSLLASNDIIGINTVDWSSLTLWPFLLNTLHSKIWEVKLTTTILVPLYNPKEGFKSLNNNNGAPTLRVSLCWGNRYIVKFTLCVSKCRYSTR